MELEFVFVESTEEHGSEVNGPDAVVGLLQTDVFLEQGMADVDPTPLPADAAVSADPADFEVSGILGLWQPVGVGARGGCVERGRWGLIEMFVRAFVVVLAAELFELALLGGSVGGRGSGGLILEGSVHAFMGAVLLGV